MDEELTRLIGDCFKCNINMFDVIISSRIFTKDLFEKFHLLNIFEKMKFLMENLSVKYNKNLFVGFSDSLRSMIVNHYRGRSDEKQYLCDLVPNGFYSCKIGPQKYHSKNMADKKILYYGMKIVLKKVIYFPMSESSEQFREVLDWAYKAKGEWIGDVKYLGFSRAELEEIRRSLQPPKGPRLTSP